MRSTLGHSQSRRGMRHRAGTASGAAPAAIVVAMAVLTVLAGVGFAVPPTVQNVQFAQRVDGSRLVDITYDISDSDSAALAVTVNASDDGGVTWRVPCLSLTGDVGQGVTPGTGKHIVWDVGLDHPAVAVAEFVLQVLASDTGVMHHAHSPENIWIINWSADVDWTVPDAYEKFARADVIVLPAYFYWGNAANELRRPLEQIRAINPSVKIVGYILAKTNMTWWTDLPVGTFGRDMYDRTEPFWSYTTTGDTLMDFKGQVVLDILDPDCRRVMVDTIVEHHRASNNVFDGVFWDYFPHDIWIHPNVVDQVSGDPDLDGDGIAHQSDPDERIAFRSACADLVTAVRDSLGEQYIQIFNGTRPHTDTAFAALADGLYFELFPTQVFPDPDMAHALDRSYAHNLWAVRDRLRTAAGGPYIGLGNLWRTAYTDNNGVPLTLEMGDVFRAVALLTDTYSCWLSGGQHLYGFPGVPINLGPPLGPTESSGNVHTRQFKYGSVKVTMGTGAYPNPFDYEIRVNGRVVQMLDIPFHFP